MKILYAEFLDNLEFRTVIFKSYAPRDTNMSRSNLRCEMKNLHKRPKN